ncbi:MAG: hypothetical protein MK101_04565 [Phycisphaerales bacterium]|nr:hypothetical protein [Phycisphaerales bacterium]
MTQAFESGENMRLFAGAGQAQTDAASQSLTDSGSQPRDRVVILGRRGAGKTVYLARLYEALWQNREGLLARAMDGRAHQRFMELVAMMEAGQWPEATLAQSWSNLEIRYGARQWMLWALDYPGEVFRRAFVENAQDEAATALRTHVDKAAAVLVLVDPVTAARGGVEATVDAEFGLSAALRRVHTAAGSQEVPVALVLTKCDIALGHIREVGTARAFVDHHLPGLVRDGGDFRVFAASAVRSRPDALGQLRPATDKDPLGIVEPLQWCLKRLARGDGGDA